MQDREKINKNPYNNKGQRHGYWEVYWHNNNLWYKCFYVNWEKYGYFESYLNTGELKRKIYYAR